MTPREHWFQLIQSHFEWHRQNGDVLPGEYTQQFMDRFPCLMCFSLSERYHVLSGFPETGSAN